MPTPAAPKEPAATHRLHRMIVQEVSLVDRAANQRKFLVIKRDESMAKPVKKEDAAQATANVAADAAGGAPTGSAPAGAMQAQVKEELTGALADAAEKLVAIANQVDTIEVTDQPADPPVPADVTKQIADAAQALVALAAKFGAPAAAAAAGAPVAAADGGTTPAAASNADPQAKAAEEAALAIPLTPEEQAAIVAAVAELTTKGMAPAKHADLVAKSVAARLSVKLDAAQLVVRKAGRRMAKERLDRLGKAIDMLIGLMKELRYENEKSARKTAAAAQAATQKSAGAPADQSLVLSLLADAEALVDVTKAQASTLAKTEGELATARARIATLEKQTSGSNALPVEKNGAPAAPIAWPLDMNADRNRNRPATAR